MTNRRRGGVGLLGGAVVACALPWAGGCALLNGFLDPTAVGRFAPEYREGGIRRVLTPRETPPGIAGATEPTPEDLVPVYEDYRVGPGDQIAVSIEDFLAQGVPFQDILEVSPTGYLRIPQIGSIKADGMTEQELEQEIRNRIREANILPNPVVRLFTQVRRNYFFTAVGGVGAEGPYTITQPDLRLLEAIGLVRGIGPEVKRLYVFRRQAGATAPPPTTEPKPKDGLIIPPPDDDQQFESTLSTRAGQGRTETPRAAEVKQESREQKKAQEDITRQELEEILRPGPPAQRRTETTRPYEPLIFDPQTGLPVEAPRPKEEPEPAPPAEPTPPPSREAPHAPFDWEELPEYEQQQRIIEIDVRSLRSGDPRYNIVIRNRDVIEVPVDTGVFYMMGEVNRPGVYALGGREITIKQAIAIAGNLTPLAWPQRCEIIRREPGTDKQITIPVNLDAIFWGLEDDVLLRDEDIVNVGTHYVAPFLFVIRNSFRFTYGFGFVYDRNYADKDSYIPKQNPETRRDAARAQRGLPF